MGILFAAQKTLEDKIDIIRSVIGNIQAEQHEIGLNLEGLKSDINNVNIRIQRFPTSRESLNNGQIDSIYGEVNKLRLEFPNLRNQINTNTTKLQEVLNIWAEILKARKR
jgi:predicted nuclease with TOPRIM domain